LNGFRRFELTEAMERMERLFLELNIDNLIENSLIQELTRKAFCARSTRSSVERVEQNAEQLTA